MKKLIVVVFAFLFPLVAQAGIEEMLKDLGRRAVVDYLERVEVQECDYGEKCGIKIETPEVRGGPEVDVDVNGNQKVEVVDFKTIFTMPSRTIKF